MVESSTINPKLFSVGVPIKFPWKRRNFVEFTINQKSHDLLVQFVNSRYGVILKLLKLHSPKGLCNFENFQNHSYLLITNFTWGRAIPYTNLGRCARETIVLTLFCFAIVVEHGIWQKSRSLSKLRWRREGERHQTKGLMSRTIAVHVRYKSFCYIAGVFPATARPFIGWIMVTWHLTMKLFPAKCHERQHCENYDVKRETVHCYPRNVDRCCTWWLESQRGFQILLLFCFAI